MTLMLGGSILLIAASAIALVMGWVDANESYIWTSIAATAAAAILLSLAFFRSRSQHPVPDNSIENRGAAIDPEILADRDKRSQQKYERATTRGKDEDDAAQTQALAPDASAPDAPAAGAAGATAATVGPPAGKETDDTKAIDSPGDPDEAQAGAGDGETSTVVAVPKTKKFHRSDCRFATAKNTESLSRSDAEGRGFAPCSVCNP